MSSRYDGTVVFVIERGAAKIDQSYFGIFNTTYVLLLQVQKKNVKINTIYLPKFMF